MFWRRFLKKGNNIKMPKTTTKTNPPKTTVTLTGEHIDGMIERALRKGFQDQARNLETYLTDIDRRLNFLEGKGRP
tara:strand:+ start:220 stop:447 length:228 start_codon:yes stop_codon:yes gene_type:complete